MSPAQKVIKYVAMAFAVGIMVTILSSILLAVTGITQSNALFASDKDYIDFTKEFELVENLDISNYSGKIYVQPGNVDKVIVDAKNVPDSYTATMERSNTLVIQDHDRDDFIFTFWFHVDMNDDETKITITIPKESYFNSVTFDNGSGKMEVSGIQTDSFYLEGGSGGIIVSNTSAGKAEVSTGSGSVGLENVNIRKGSIDTGSGAVRISSCQFNDVEFDTGSGSMSFEGSLTGESSISGGSGSIEIELAERFDQYDLELEAGSGGIWVNGDRKDDQDIKNPDASNELRIDGGSGRVSLSFVN